MSRVTVRGSRIEGQAEQGHPGGRISQCLARLAAHQQVRSLALILGILLMLALPLPLGRLWTRVLVQAGLGIMMGLGLNVMLGYTGLANLGYTAYYAMGAYLYALLASPQHDRQDLCRGCTHVSFGSFGNGCGCCGCGVT